MKISITVEINETDSVFEELRKTEKISIGIVYNKYKFDILNDTQEKRLIYIATEISLRKNDVIVGNCCYNLFEILYLNKELKHYNLSLNTVYIPSNERIEKMKAEAMENARLHGRWIGSSAKEVQKSFSDLKLILNEIKSGLENEAIEVREV